jgi:ligand-binding sensor domain-containing protein/signal transduction histidine kinase
MTDGERQVILERACLALLLVLSATRAESGPARQIAGRAEDGRAGEPVVAVGPAADAGWRALAVYGQPQGLPQSSVYSLLQTRDGYLWVGTRGGLARFDGVRFTTFDNRDKSQLRESEIWSLVEADDASLWIGTFGGGVSRLKDGRFQVFGKKEGLASDFVTSLAKGPDGSIWIGTDGGVSRFKDGRFSTFTRDDGLAHNFVRSIFVGRDGLWTGTNKGALNRIVDGRVLPVALEGPTPTSEIYQILGDSRGIIWIPTADGLFRIEGRRSTRLTTADGLSSDTVHVAYEDARGGLWLGTDKGLDRLVGDRIVRLGYEQTSMHAVRAIAGDREGSLWVGSFVDGLARLREQQFTSLTVRDGLPDNNATTVFQDRRGDVWIGTANGVARLTESAIVTYPIDLPGGNNRISAMLEDRHGRLWVGAEPGLYVLTVEEDRVGRRGRYQYTPVVNPAVPRMMVRVMLEDRSGAIWMGTDLDGLMRYQDGRFTTYTTKQGLPHSAVRGLAEDRDGTLWIGTRGGGLSRFRDGVITTFTAREGFGNTSVQALYFDRDQTLWIATREGISRLKDGRFATYTMNDGLYASHIYGFVEDDHGMLWMSSGKGVFRVSLRQLNAFADGRTKTITSTAYGLEHGLESTVGQVAHHPIGYKTRDGRVWICMLRGVSFVDPITLSSNQLPPPVHIESVSVNQRTSGPTTMVDAPPGRGDIAIRYTGLSFVAPEKVSFQYMLEGYDQTWVEAGDRREAYYNNIPPGRYVFRVKAANNDGVWNEAGAAVTLELEPHVYQTWGFYAACGLFGLMSVVGLHRVRIHRLRAREQELVRAVADRTRDLEDEVMERRRAEVSMRESEARARALLSAVPDFVFRIRGDGLILDYKSDGELPASLPDNLRGRNLRAVVPEAVADRLLATIVRTIESHTTERVEYEVQMEHGLRVLESRIAMCGEDEVVLISRDITDARSLEAQLRQAQKLESIGQLAAGIAHEINTPTQYVGDNVRFLQDAFQELARAQARQADLVAAARARGLAPDFVADLEAVTADTEIAWLAAEIPQALDSALDGTQRIAKIVQSMKEFAHPGAAEKSAVDLNRAIESTIAVSSSEWRYVADMETALDPNLPPVDCLLGELNQVMLNLIINAAQAIAERLGDGAGSKGTITVSSRCVDDGVEIRVSDTGAGIPEKVRSRIFDPFFTTKPVGKGTGQGLAIAHAVVVKKHGGAIGFETEEGRGTTFIIRLPLVAKPEPAAA